MFSSAGLLPLFLQSRFFSSFSMGIWHNRPLTRPRIRIEATSRLIAAQPFLVDSWRHLPPFSVRLSAGRHFSFEQIYFRPPSIVAVAALVRLFGCLPLANFGCALRQVFSLRCLLSYSVFLCYSLVTCRSMAFFAYHFLSSLWLLWVASGRLGGRQLTIKGVRLPIAFSLSRTSLCPLLSYPSRF